MSNQCEDIIREESQPRFFDDKAGEMIIASTRQKGNPILAYVSNVPYDFQNIVPDFLVGKYDAVVFISIKYHKLHKQYLRKRVESLQKNYKVRVLLCLVDIPPSGAIDVAILEITDICFDLNMTLFLAWSPKEAGHILETLKSHEKSSSESIRGGLSLDLFSRIRDTLSSLPRINKTDSENLLKHFGSISNVVNASEEELSKIQGIGPIKAKVISEVFSTEFSEFNI
ncbi:ERCC1 excision repair 1 C-terminal domain [Cryptosporidium sp. chipmunk genotype I]|uniref:ERCC1 excision repair 1 C-terminal domain n=1 Tax=Cryptosporidium sp. chipmunk genotype I TaxID=1280935 RepID=UPI00351A0631|nr:ERCC1 excision repair 1 C-terminal domain [Cryptosporidium sp. chipmunk genotype I]